MFFYPLRKKYADTLTGGFSAMLSACSVSGGTRSCSCHSDPNWHIADPTLSLKESFYCLPNECLCNDGSVEKFNLWASFCLEQEENGNMDRRRRQSLYAW